MFDLMCNHYLFWSFVLKSVSWHSGLCGILSVIAVSVTWRLWVRILFTVNRGNFERFQISNIIISNSANNFIEFKWNILVFHVKVTVGYVYLFKKEI